MKEILQQHLDAEIGINIESDNTIEPVVLKAIHDKYFTVVRQKNKDTYHIPFSSIVKMIANENGVIVGGFLEHKHSFSFVIHIGHMVEYLPT